MDRFGRSWNRCPCASAQSRLQRGQARSPRILASRSDLQLLFNASGSFLLQQLFGKGLLFIGAAVQAYRPHRV
ncbi:MAG: hypothetical protein ACK46L_14745, partial [Synechococcaceae cyanobacterium]